ncbi:hypothetical protein BDW74DRAFT_162482 [Aspergillus multicolor]|uniref:uncharacterized protein n=1 Tax=Aspergillus multicolor TaxID=41759 RepID=UPI003CCE0035
MSKAVYDDLLQKIRDTNEALKTLIEQSAQLEISREKRSPWRKLLPRLREARRNAEGLYRAIVHGSYWSCQCRDSHSAHLHLESNPLADSVKSNKQSSFWITFSNSRTLGSEKWTWTDVEFEPCELEANQVCSVMHVEETTASLKKLQISQSQRVRFNIPRVTDKGRNQTSNLPPIENICSMLSHSEKQPLKQGTLGFIVCEPGSTKRYNLHLIKCHSQAVPLQTLQQALPRSSRRDRLYIAAGLARGVVQYHGNWLKAHWDSSDIHLMANDDDGGYLTSEIVYLSWSLKMQQAEISPGDRDEHPSTGRSPLIRNQILFPLALALTELSIGKSIASLRQPRDEQGNNNDENSIRFNTACRLLQNVYRESGSNYGDAVHSCLFWPGAEPRSGINTLCFEDEKFEGKVFSTGVTPLLRDLAHFDDLGAALAY